MIDRRRFIGAMGAGSLVAMFPFPALAAAPRVVVVGGGMAGATVAKYLRLWSGKTIDVTLVTPATTYTSNIMSNLVITGQVAYKALNFTYANLSRTYGVKVVTGTVSAVNGFGSNAGGTVTVLNGPTRTQLSCERVIIAPGVQFDPVPLSENAALAAPVLHAWQAGQQTLDLQKLLAGMPNGGTFLMSIPAKPYRCPPGPYERACVVADYLKRNKPGAKIIVLDANPGIVAEPTNFGNAFQSYFAAGVLEYWPSTAVVSASNASIPGSGQSVTVNVAGSGPMMPAGLSGLRTLVGNVVNLIPAHRAPQIASLAGVVPAGSRFAPVDVLNYESTLVGKIHIIGDAADTTLPKAGHVGNQEAKICAAAIINAFRNRQPDPAPTANSACYSPIDNKRASWLTVVYQYDPVTKKMVAWDGVLNQPGAPTEAASPSTGNFSKMSTWYKVLMSDSFA